MKRLKLILCLLLSLPAVAGASPLETISPPITDFFIPVHQRSVEPVRNSGDFIGQVFAPNPEDRQTRPEAAPITGVPVMIASGPRTGESVATNPNSVDQAILAAKNDVGESFDWFAGSFLTSVAFGCLGGTVAAVNAPIAILELSSLASVAFGCLGGTAVAVTAQFIPVTAPTHRLMGKSATYVNAYITAYKREVRNKRLIYTSTGCVSGSAVAVYSLTLVLTSTN